MILRFISVSVDTLTLLSEGDIPLKSCLNRIFENTYKLFPEKH